MIRLRESRVSLLILQNVRIFERSSRVSNQLRGLPSEVINRTLLASLLWQATKVERFNEHHPDLHIPEQFDQEDGLFKFEKRIIHD